jgi:uncharacterized Zn finger protein
MNPFKKIPHDHVWIPSGREIKTDGTEVELQRCGICGQVHGAAMEIASHASVPLSSGSRVAGLR